MAKIAWDAMRSLGKEFAVAKKKRKRLVRGKDFDYWAIRFPDGSYYRQTFKLKKWCERKIRCRTDCEVLRVKFVEVPWKP